MLNKILLRGASISTTPAKQNFVIDCLQHLEILTRDYSNGLQNVLNTFSNHHVNFSNIESMRLKRTEKGQSIAVKITVEDQKFCHILNDLRRSFEDVFVLNDQQVPCVPWYPRNDDDLNTICKLIPLNEELDYSQYKDQEYKKKRQEIGNLSQSHQIGQPIPIIEYSKEEQDTWKYIYTKLREEVQAVMSQRYLKNLMKVEKDLGLKYQIPQLSDIDAYLKSETGFRIKAAGGMLGQREFLNALGHKVFCCTQYIRHHSNPEYSPEPDLVHEFVGHLPQFIDKEIADISQQIGILSCGVNSSDISRLGTLYLYTLEFGAIKENGQIKGYGAGIAGCIDECKNFYKVKHQKFDPFQLANEKFSLQTVQPFYAYSENIQEAMEKLILFGKSLNKPFELYYDDKEKQLKSTTRIRTYLEDQ